MIARNRRKHYLCFHHQTRKNMERDEYTDRYVNPYTDFGFKKLFGTEMNKELLISFINSLLSDKEQIRDLTYLNTENLGISEADRKAVFDVYCETDSGEKILVEMQRGQQLFFKERTLPSPYSNRESAAIGITNSRPCTSSPY